MMTVTQATLDELSEALLAATLALDPVEQRIVVGLYRALSHGTPVAPVDLATDLGIPSDQVNDALDVWPGVYRNRSGNVVGFWGLALSDMPHELDTGRAAVRTWCALDPFLILPLLDIPDARVRSTDPLAGDHPGTFLLDIDETNSVALATWPSMVRSALDTLNQ
jgi:hypothetical protein